jgi:hypothetical protein
MSLTPKELKMKFLTTAAMFFLTSSVAMGSMSQALPEDDAPYTDVTSIQAALPAGSSTYDIELEAPMDPANLSVWYAPSRTCSAFAVQGVHYVDANGDWQRAEMSIYRNNAHFRTTEVTSRISVTISTDRIFGMRCNIFIKKANFEVPLTYEMLARYSATCDADDVCAHSITRIDTDLREVLTISDEDARQHNLQADGIYKLKGYVQPQGGTDTIFVILSSQKIM